MLQMLTEILKIRELPIPIAAAQDVLGPDAHSVTAQRLRQALIMQPRRPDFGPVAGDTPELQVCPKAKWPSEAGKQHKQSGNAWGIQSSKIKCMNWKQKTNNTQYRRALSVHARVSWRHNCFCSSSEQSWMDLDFLGGMHSSACHSRGLIMHQLWFIIVAVVSAELVFPR